MLVTFQPKKLAAWLKEFCMSVQAGAPQLMKTKLLPVGIGFEIGTVGPILAGGLVKGAIFAWSPVKSAPEAAADVLLEPAAALPPELGLELELELLPHAATNSASVSVTVRAKPGPRPHRNDRIFLLSPLLVPRCNKP
jgi:hypothetical protein